MSIDKPKVNPSALKEGTGAKAATTPTPAKEPEVIPDKLWNVYHSRISSMRMLTPTGRSIAFVLSKYVTDQPEEIEYLDSELALGSKQIFTEEGAEKLSQSDLDPMAALRKQHYAQFVKTQAEVARKIAAGEPLSTSESEVQKLTPASTATNKVTAAGSGV